MSVEPASAVNLPSAEQSVATPGIGQVGGGAGNQWGAFFGQTHGPGKVDPYGHAPLPNYNLTDGYIGRTLFVREQVKGYLLESLEPYYTLMLPWLETNQHHIQWNELRFNRTIAGRTPHEAPSRYITTEKTQHRDHVVRRGLAFIMEVDRANTPEGRQDYVNNIKGILQSVLETVSHDTIYTILISHDDKKSDRTKNQKLSLDKLVQEQIDNFAVLNSNNQQLVKLIERYKRYLRKHVQGAQVGQLLLIVGPETPIELHKINTDRKPVPYFVLGEGGQALARDGPMTLVRAEDGTAIIPTRDFVVDANEPEVQLLTRPVLTSEKYDMCWRHTNTSLWDGIQEITRCTHCYETGQRNVVVYDERGDQLKAIGFIDAIENSDLFDDPLLGEVESSRAWTADDFGNTRNAPMRLHWDPASGRARRVNYFGVLDQSVANHRHHEQTGITLLAGASGLPEDALDLYETSKRFLQEMEGTPYNEAFFRGLIEENVGRNATDAGAFAGVTTMTAALDVVQRWRYASGPEWSGTFDCGGLRLPAKTRAMDDITHPPGFASYVGLCEYARHASRAGSGWQDGGKMAKLVLTLVDRLYDRAAKAFPESEALRADNRPPWFHKQTGKITFFHNLFWVNRPPAALAFVPPAVVAEVGSAAPSSPVVSGRWASVPLTSSMGGNGNAGPVARGIQSSLGSARSSGIFYVFHNGPGFTIAGDQAMHALATAPEARAARLCGAAGTTALRTMASMLLDRNEPAGAEAWKSLIDFLTGPDVKPRGWSAPAFATGLQAKISDIDGGAAKIEYIHNTTKAPALLSRNQRRAQRTTQGEIVAAGGTDGVQSAAFSTTSGEPFRPTVSSRASVVSDLSDCAGRIWRLTRQIHGARLARDSGYNADHMAYAFPSMSGIAVPFGGLVDFHSMQAQGDVEEELFGLLNAEEATMRQHLTSAETAGIRVTPSSSQTEAPLPDSAPIGQRVAVDLVAWRGDGARWYRSPLVMTSGLLRSLKRAPAGDAGEPLVRPMDPQGLLSFRIEDFGDQETLPEFTRVGLILNRRNVVHTSFGGHLRRHMEQLDIDANRPESSVSDDQFATGRRSIDSDAMDDSISSILYGSESAGPSKRARRAEVPLGDPLGGWGQAAAPIEGALDSAVYTGAVPPPGTGAREAVDAFAQANFVRNFNETSRNNNPLTRMMTQVFLMAPASKKEHWMVPLHQNVLMPVNILVFRPMLEHDMDTYIRQHRHHGERGPGPQLLPWWWGYEVHDLQEGPGKHQRRRPTRPDCHRHRHRRDRHRKHGFPCWKPGLCRCSSHPNPRQGRSPILLGGPDERQVRIQQAV